MFKNISNYNFFLYIYRKYEEIYPPDIAEFVYITDDTYTKKQVLRMEQLILGVLHFNMSSPTVLSFITSFCVDFQSSEPELYLAMVNIFKYLLNNEVKIFFSH